MLAADTLAKLPDPTLAQAEHWIAAALAAAGALRQYDDRLYPAAGDAGALQVANQLHDAWRKWAEDAEAIYQRVTPLLRGHVDGAHDLSYAIARARAMLKLTPETMQARRGQAERGDTLSAEEVRRELRLGNRR